MISKFLESYGILLVFLAFLVWRFFRFRLIKKQLPELMRQGGVVIDVRTRGEYASGASAGSVNIPLDEIASVAKMFTADQPIILCCASGARSGIALSMIKRMGFKKAVNAGPWTNTLQ